VSLAIQAICSNSSIKYTRGEESVSAYAVLVVFGSTAFLVPVYGVANSAKLFVGRLPFTVPFIPLRTPPHPHY
jgi:hypothetical protein